MHPFDQRILGIVLLLLLCMLVVVKRAATGSILDKPTGAPLLRLVNSFNLLFLLLVIPLTAILLITGSLATVDPTHAVIDEPSVLMAFEIVGLLICVVGFVLMASALVTLGHAYQLGGSAPRSEDRIVTTGSYRFVRHPMYTAALAIALGLACLIQSWALFGVFCVYLVLILMLIPVEEDGLRQAYGEQYGVYQQETHKLIPFVY